MRWDGVMRGCGHDAWMQRKVMLITRMILLLPLQIKKQHLDHQRERGYARPVIQPALATGKSSLSHWPPSLCSAPFASPPPALSIRQRKCAKIAVAAAESRTARLGRVRPRYAVDAEEGGRGKGISLTDMQSTLLHGWNAPKALRWHHF